MRVIRIANSIKLSTPIGVVEWVASDGRKGKLSGHGESRSHGEANKKVPSEKGGDAPKDWKNKDNKKEKVMAEDDNPHGFTKDEDEKMLEWKATNSNKPWTTFADEIGKSADQCKERFKQIRSKDSNQNTSNDKSNGGGGGKGGGNGGGQNNGGGEGGGGDQQNLTKKQKKALNKENKGGGQVQGQQQKNNKKEEKPGGDPADLWGATTGGNDNNDTGDSGDLWGAMPGMGDDAVDHNNDKNSKKSNSSNKLDDKEAAPAWGELGGWEGAADVSSGNNVASWETTNNNSGGSKKDGTSNKGSSSNKGGNGWGDAAGGWNINENSGGSKRADGSNKGGNIWEPTANISCGDASWGGADLGANNGFDANATWGDTGGGGTGDPKDAWNSSSQKPTTNNGGGADAWTTGVDGANDTTGGGWCTTNDQTNTNGNNNTGFDNTDWSAPAAKSASKANTHKSAHHHSHRSDHRSNKDHTNAPLYLEVKPDSTFSADDLRLVARILQQDYQMVWSRVSWRFRDKTGRTIAPEVFEKKITGRINGEKERRK
jgi:hypothetical protein